MNIHYFHMSYYAISSTKKGKKHHKSIRSRIEDFKVKIKMY